MFKRELKHDWHVRDETTLAAAREYFGFLRALFASRPDLARRLAHCADCGMPFLTSPRNQNRTDLRCVFGCRKAHYREESNRRSKACYRKPAVWKDKKAHNSKRSGRPQKRKLASPPVPTSNVDKAIKDLLPYLRLVTSWIERRPVSKDELRPIATETMRQRSMEFPAKTGYGVFCPKNKPP